MLYRRGPLDVGGKCVCMYTPTASGGHARYTHELLSTMAEVSQDINVALVTSRDLDSDYRDTSYPIYDILPPLRSRDEFPNTMSWGASRITHYLERERCFLSWLERDRLCAGVHFQEYTPWLMARHIRLLKNEGLSVYFTVHQAPPETYFTGMPGFLKPLYYSMVRKGWRLCDALFVHTDGLKEKLEKFLGEEHPPIFVTPHGVWSNRGDTSHELANRSSRRRLLFFGVNRSSKGLDVLLDAMKELDDCHLTVAGLTEDQRYQERILTLMKQIPSERIDYLNGFIKEHKVSELFAQSSLVVFPYKQFSGQSGVLHDAVSQGLPVVVTDVGALGESVKSWKIGKVVPPNDSESLARAVRETLEPRYYEEARKAVYRVREELSWSEAAKSTLEAYKSTMLHAT